MFGRSIAPTQPEKMRQTRSKLKIRAISANPELDSFQRLYSQPRGSQRCFKAGPARSLKNAEVPQIPNLNVLVQEIILFG